MWRQWQAAHGKRVVRELVAEGLIDAASAEERKEAKQLVCLMATHGAHYAGPTHMLRVRQLVPNSGAFTELPYPFAPDGNTYSCTFGPATWTAHSCVPNVWASLASPLQTLTLLARRTIRVGEQITLSLVDEAQVATARRQEWLQQLCGFDCNCERCRGRCWSTMVASPVGPCAACGFSLVNKHSGGGFQCGSCHARVLQQQVEQIAFVTDTAAKVTHLSNEIHALEEAAYTPGAARQYGSLRRLLRLAADAETSFGPCSVFTHSCTEMLHDLYAHALQGHGLPTHHARPLCYTP
jgi:hypothetical protein